MTDYFYAGGGIGLGPPAPKPEAVPYPRPKVTSRDGVEIGMTEMIQSKRAVMDLVKLARLFGWDIRITYARGCFPHATTGAPGPLKESLAVRMTRVGGWRAAAVYEGADKSWAWGTLAVQSLNSFPKRFDSLEGFTAWAFGPIRLPVKAGGPMLGPARRALKIWGPLQP